MPDEEKQVDENQQVDQQNDNDTETTPTIEELMQKLADNEAMFEKQKNEIAGLNKAISKKDQEKLELLKQTETAEETAKREAEEKRIAWETKQNELATKEMELRNQENSLTVKLKATELGISLDEVGKLKLNSIEQLEAYKELKESLIKQNTESTTAKLNKDLSSVDRGSYKSEGNTSQGFPSVIERALSR